MDTCQGCKFYDAAGGGSAQPSVCRLRPPQPLGRGPNPGGWPTVDVNDWCGSFTAVTPPA